MALKLTPKTKDWVNQTSKEPVIVICLEKLDYCFSTKISQVTARFGMKSLFFGKKGLVFGGTAESETQLDYINISTSSNSISQQLELDKANASSTTQAVFDLVDFDGEITKLISPSFVIDELLYSNARVFLGGSDLRFPEEYVDLMVGKITNIESASGSVKLTLDNAEASKRNDVFEKTESILAATANYKSLKVQDITYYQLGDISGNITIAYQDFFYVTDHAEIQVTGSNILVKIGSVTTAKEIKKQILNNADSNQLVTCKITGNQSTVQTVIGVTSFVEDTTISLESVVGFFSSVGNYFKTYIRIADEIISYTGIDYVTNELTGCVRAQLGSIGDSHAIGAQVSSFYVLGDNTSNSNAIKLTLDILLSGSQEFYAEEIAVKSVNIVTSTVYKKNYLVIAATDIYRTIGLTVGDKITTTGSIIPQNNVTDKRVSKVTYNGDYSIIKIDDVDFLDENTTLMTCSFSSQYNILPSGCGLSPVDVDIKQFTKTYEVFSSSIPAFQFYLKDSINAKDFINKEIFLPSALIPVPRNARLSIKKISAPLYEDQTKTISLLNTINPDKIKLKRSINKNFYNSVIYKYDKDSVEDKFLRLRSRVDAASLDRIKVPLKPFVIESSGLRDSIENKALIDSNAKRIIERMRYAAESFDVEVSMQTGFTVEIGDTVLVDDSNLKISDTTNGTRETSTRLFEVINKEYNWKTSFIKMTLLDTKQSLTARYGVFSPSSYVGIGSTTTSIILADSALTPEDQTEPEKWANYVGKNIKITSPDYAFIYNSKIQAFSNSNPYEMIIDPPIGLAPTEGYLVDIENYDSIDANDVFLKLVHPFWTPQATVTVATSVTSFDVDDVSLFFVGAKLQLVNDDYSVITNIVKVISIAASTLTVETLDTVPTVGLKVELIGFVSDAGDPYLFL